MNYTLTFKELKKGKMRPTSTHAPYSQLSTEADSE